MSNAVLLPKLGLTMEHGIVMSWAKQEGDTVHKGDILFQVESDKAVVDVESDFDGILLKRYYKDGDDVPCGHTVAVVGLPGEVVPGEIPVAVPAETSNGLAEMPFEEKQTDRAMVNSGFPASPRARRLASRENVELSMVGKGSGEGGRIKERDVARYIQGRKESGAIRISSVARNILAASGTSAEGITGTGPGGRIMKRDVLMSHREPEPALVAEDEESPRRLPLSAMRATIARRLSESKRTIPHYYVSVSVNMANFVETRTAWNGTHPDQKVSMNAMLIKVVAMALKKHPLVNASWADDGILLYPSANIALAVSTEKGLITPVVKKCDRKAVMVINSELEDLISRARKNALKPEEFSGSTCTVTNLGMYGVEEFSAIINPPEASILAVAAIVDTPVAEGQTVVIRPMMKITMSADHRVIDGAACAEFLNEVRMMLEHPFFGMF